MRTVSAWISVNLTAYEYQVSNCACFFNKPDLTNKCQTGLNKTANNYNKWLSNMVGLPCVEQIRQTWNNRRPRSVSLGSRSSCCCRGWPSSRCPKSLLSSGLGDVVGAELPSTFARSQRSWSDRARRSSLMTLVAFSLLASIFVVLFKWPTS